MSGLLILLAKAVAVLWAAAVLFAASMVIRWLWEDRNAKRRARQRRNVTKVRVVPAQGPTRLEHYQSVVRQAKAAAAKRAEREEAFEILLWDRTAKDLEALRFYREQDWRKAA
jgi:hypothetical protein